MKAKMIVGVVALLACVLTVAIYAQMNAKPSIPKVELDALFAAADKNGDGQISKAEFEAYLQMMRTSSKPTAATQAARICPTTGQPCTGSGMCSGGGCGSGGGGCCSSGGKTAAAMAAEVGGCCSGKTASATGGCCKDGGEAVQGGCCQVDGGECDGRCGE